MLPCTLFIFFANFANAYSIANSNFKHIDLGEWLLVGVVINEQTHP